MVYTIGMYRILQTEAYRKWFRKLRDCAAKYSIALRLERMRSGNFGDSKSIGGGIFELRIDTGKGYRVYFKNRGKEIVVLLVGGDKSTQEDDIRKAQKIAEEI